MLKIRLRRVGRKKQPSYRVVIAESTAPRDGKFVEVIGFYNPRTEPETFTLKEERALHWLSVGAQPTDAVARLFNTHGTADRFERLKAGEALETLVAEAAVEEETAKPAAPVKVEAESEPELEPEVEDEPEIEETPEAEETEAAEAPEVEEPASEAE